MAAALIVAGLVSPAAAQLLGRGGLAGGLGPTSLPTVDLRQAGLASGLGRELDPQSLVNLRNQRLVDLVRAHHKVLELDDHGDPIVRGELILLSPTATALAGAQAAGFVVADQSSIDGGDLTLTVLKAPAGVSTKEALKRLRIIAPDTAIDFDHIYLPTAAPHRASSDLEPTEPQGPLASASVRLGLVDTGVDAAHPALAVAHIEQRGFAPGGVAAQGHGTAVASLLVGREGVFRGAAPGATLLAADVYGSAPTGGAAAMLVRALAWEAMARAQVINISLVGPPNAILAAVVKALMAKGLLIVAAVGNDGPAAPPAYPASYPGVIAVTGVDDHGRVLPEAGRAIHVDFAAPAADMAAAWTGGRFAAVRGTSFAAPLVAGRLALLENAPRGSPAAAIDRLSAMATHRRDYGRGLVGVDLRTPPRSVDAGAPRPGR
jgi:hypothetical protein